MVNNRDSTSSDKDTFQSEYAEDRAKRQVQPNTSEPSQSRPMLQPLIMGTLTFASYPVQITVGAAGGASALPATPTGYLQMNLGNTLYVIPFYAPS